MKRKLIFIFFILITSISILYLSGFYFKYREFMGVKEACKRWGEQGLDPIQFKFADEDESKRAGMVCSLIRNKKKYIGKNGLEIRNLFGDYSGHYFSEMYPAYLIESAKKDGEDSWQIVFLINKEGKVKDIVVHKNCCGSWKKELLLRLPL